MFLKNLFIKVGNRFRNREPDLLISEIQRRVNNMLYFVGCEIYDHHFTLLNLRLAILIFDIVTYFMINSYSIWHFWGDLEAVAFCSVTMTMGFQGTAKILTYVGNRKMFNEIIEDQIQNYKRSTAPKLAKHQEQMAIICACYALFIFILYASVGALTLVYSLVMTLAVGERTLPFGLILPGLETLSNVGFYLNWIHHILQVWFTVIGLITTDIMSGVYLLLIVGRLSMLSIMFDDYSKKGQPSSAGGHLDADNENTGEGMTKIIEMHMRITKQIDDLVNVFVPHNFTQICSLEFQLTMTTVACFWLTWIPGYFIFVMVYFQLFFACFFGTVLAEKCDQFALDLYKIDWYAMSLSDQKRMLQVLHMAQRRYEMHYGLNNLSLSTFVEISKSVYQLNVFLENFSGR